MRAGVGLGMAVVLALGALGQPPGERTPLVGPDTRPVADRSPGRGVEIKVRADRPQRKASTGLLGVNHQFVGHGMRSWDPETDAPTPKVVAGTRRAGVQYLRFPGGTVANLYDWKKAIGPDRGCQVDGRRVPGRGSGDPIGGRLSFGVDEYMEFIEQSDARPFLMVPFVTETPEDAAGWVEYMNTRAGDGVNPQGGTDWAEVRAANGHPAPYNVRRWEIGNEQQNPRSRYWMSQDPKRAVRQYAFGGQRRFVNQPLGRHCTHKAEGVPSNGKPGQKYFALYSPVDPETVTVTVDGEAWTRVDDLMTAGPSDEVFAASSTGKVQFGDGVNGAIPPEGAEVRGSYTSVHEGFFDFAREMREVDPSIKVCASWGEKDLLPVAKGRRLDCLTTHAIVTFGTQGGTQADWDSPLEGHDAFMVYADRKEDGVRGLIKEINGRAPLWLTEFASILGDPKGYPHWATSASHAVFMSSLWASWMRLGIDVGLGSTLLWTSNRSVLSPYPDFTFSAEAMTRQALSPMFESGGKVLKTEVERNPQRNGVGRLRTYPALSTVAVKDRRGPLYLMVINRLPSDAVKARVSLAGFRAKGKVKVRTVDSRSYRAWNHPGQAPDVRLRTDRRSFKGSSFTHRFPSTSTTVFVIPQR